MNAPPASDPGAAPPELPFFTNIDSESVTLMAGALALQSDNDFGTNIFYYDGVDAPEGAFMCWLFGTTASMGISLNLPATLPSNTYYVFFFGICYHNDCTMDLTMGGGSSGAVGLIDDDASKYWSSRATVTTSSPANSMALTLHRNVSGGSDQRFLFRGIYITTNADYTITHDSVAVNLNYPSVMDDAAAVKGNLIANGGFETGLDNHWAFEAQGGGSIVPLNTMWDNTQGHSGAACLKVVFPTANRLQPGNNAIGIISRVYHLKPNKQYTLTGWFKKSAGTTCVATLKLRNTFLPPSGHPAQYELTSTDDVIGASWQKVKINTDYLLEYPTSDYQIYINCYITADATLLIDDLQLEEGTETAFAAAANLEAAVLINMTTQPSNIFWDTDTITGTLTARNNTGSTQAGDLKYEVYEVMNALVVSGSVSLSVAANTTHTESFNLDVGKLGIFRLVTWIDGVERTEREITYSIIPEPSTSGVDLASHVGIHPNYFPFQLAALQKMGVKWVRDLSPAAYGRWNLVEPVDDTFVFFDTEIDAAISYGLTPMCVLGTNDFWPTWAASGAFFDLDKWAEFCGQMADHYSPRIQYWEIWNEPFEFLNAGSSGVDFYAQMVKRAADAIHAVDSSAVIIGCGGVQLTQMTEIIASLDSQFLPAWDWRDHVVVMSTHAYVGAAAPELFTPIIDDNGVECWNTETGVWSMGFRAGIASNFVAWGKPIWPHTDAQRFYVGMMGSPNALVQNFARTVAARLYKYFYYDSRYFSAPDLFTHHPTILEYDGTIKASGIGYAIAGSLIGHAIGMGNVSADADTFALMHDTGGTNPVAILFTSNRAPKSLTLGLSGSQFEVLDLMGNPITISGTTVPYGRVVIYIRGLGISASTLSAAITAGTVAARTDTTAPNVAIVDGPRGPVTDEQGRFRMRWIAIDDTSYPNLGEINEQTLVLNETPDPRAILYSYQLSPATTWSIWDPGIYVDYSGISAGTYTFSVRARDKAGNLSQADRDVTVA